MAYYTVEQSSAAHLLFSSRKSAVLWLFVRLYIGYEWIVAGWDKVINPAWFGLEAGAPIQGFVQGALAKTTGLHPDVQGWYASFLQGAVLPNASIWANAIALGELLVGIALVLGILSGIAAFFGAFMNLNFLLAGTVSINPQMLVLQIGIVLAWRVADHYGLDRYVKQAARQVFRSRTMRMAS